jgi:leucyl/phenylalanyl-tRNA--protein transferase
MPIEPPPPPWLLPDVRLARPGEELVAIGAELTPGMLVAGYRAGMFPMPEPGLLGWWSPDPRGVLWPAQVRVARSLRRSLRRYEVSLDTCFAEVVAGCADPRRPQGWITAEYRAAYEDLFALGWAHSLEVWDATGRLVGGLFGVELGGLFAAESKFHRSTDASKVAVVALADLLAADGHPDRLVDVQWRTEHLARLGVVEVRRVEYLRLAARARALPPVLAGQAVPAGPSRIRWRAA